MCEEVIVAVFPEIIKDIAPQIQDTLVLRRTHV